MCLDYHGFEEYDGGRLSRVGRQTPAVMVPPGWPDPPEKKGNEYDIKSIVWTKVIGQNYKICTSKIQNFECFS